jgi:hypothetical protein
MNFRRFIAVISVSALHKAHEAEKKADWPPFRFLRVLLYDRNQRSGVMLQFLMAIRTRIRIHEITEFNATVGTFEFFHFAIWLKISLSLGLFSFGSLDVPPGAVSARCHFQVEYRPVP